MNLELNLETKHISLEDQINTYTPLDIPEPPRSFTEFKSYPLDKQLKLKDEFYKDAEVQEYLEKKWKSELFNRDTYLYLHDLYNKYKDTTNENLSLILSKGRDFKKKIMTYWTKSYPALRINFEKYMIEPVQVVDWND